MKKYKILLSSQKRSKSSSFHTWSNAFSRIALLGVSTSWKKYNGRFRVSGIEYSATAKRYIWSSKR